MLLTATQHYGTECSGIELYLYVGLFIPGIVLESILYVKYCAGNKIIISFYIFFVEPLNYCGLNVSPTPSSSILPVIISVQ
jgi:hypothetical protein